MVLTSYQIHGVSKITLLNYLRRKGIRSPAETCEFLRLKTDCIGTKFCILKAVKAMSISRQLAKVKALVYC